MDRYIRRHNVENYVRLLKSVENEFQRKTILTLLAEERLGQALLGRLAGLELWGTAHGAHVALIRELGATPIDYQREDFMRVRPGGFDVVFDGIGEEGYRRSFTAHGRPAPLPLGGLRAAVCSPC